MKDKHERCIITKDQCPRCGCIRMAVFHCLDRSYHSDSSKEHIEKVCRNCFYTWRERSTDFDWME